MKTKEIRFGSTSYIINDKGEVFNKDRKMSKLKGQLQRSKNGYIIYRLGYKCMLTHRLVYETFVGEIPKGMEVMHRNGDRFDNRVDNLVCGTHQDNMQTAGKHKVQGSLDALTRLHIKIKEQYKTGKFSKEVLAIEYGYPTDVIVAISRSEF